MLAAPHCLLMEEVTSKGCPLSPLFASFVVARLHEPPLMAYSANAQPLALQMAILAMTARGVFLTYSALLMISHHVFTSLTSTLPVRSRGASIGCFVNPHKTRQWDLHPTCPHYSGSTLGALTLRFHRTILNNTSFYIPVELTTGFQRLGQPD